MNTQMDISRKIMEILDDNAQQVPEGFYLEMCNQLKKLHVAPHPTVEYDVAGLRRREDAVIRSKDRLNRQAAELNRMKDQYNTRVRHYNSQVDKYKKRVNELDEDVIKVKEKQTELKFREKLLDDWSENIPLSELQKLLAN